MNNKKLWIHENNLETGIKSNTTSKTKDVWLYVVQLNIMKNEKKR